ncbi:hypothetical protein UAJ10_06520 [Nitrospirillum sp. BR 11164]|uniref:PilN domain-containing protein n=1 Tax=Nitrospirillum sp. BR 11164 TaxID=3104324 RepID=UPI002AFF70BC|nr:PilN domain-containing protein [Nitrospirillum sp. BR 11164]MEA1648666.1 hypothetical protein [Nitrospirillum sp. BR 11164]
MRRQNINFAPSGYTRLKQETPAAAKVLGILGLGLCLAAALEARDRLDRLSALDHAVAQAEVDLAARTGSRAPPPDIPVPEAQATAVNSAVRQLNLPWRALLDAVEAGTPKTVALLSLEPDARRGLVRIEAEAADGEAMLAYVKQLKQQPLLAGAVLVKHRTEESQARRPLRFQIEAGLAAGGAP